MARRHDLSFGRLDEIMPEVGRLLAGHDRSGSWSLGQVLHHLATAIRLTTAGAASPAAAGDRSAEVARKRFFRSGRFPEGVSIPHPSLVPPADADERAEAETLRSALRRFNDHEGPFPAHPLLGPLTREEWAAFHRMHCAHHLGFLRPTSADSPPPPDSGGQPERGPA